MSCDHNELDVYRLEENNTGTIIASGLLGGEGITGVIIALIIAVQAVI